MYVWSLRNNPRKYKKTGKFKNIVKFNFYFKVNFWAGGLQKWSLEFSKNVIKTLAQARLAFLDKAKPSAILIDVTINN